MSLRDIKGRGAEPFPAISVLSLCAGLFSDVPAGQENRESFSYESLFLYKILAAK
jgi:hypothetical protein